jgi:hypothetical protein
MADPVPAFTLEYRFNMEPHVQQLPVHTFVPRRYTEVLREELSVLSP